MVDPRIEKWFERVKLRLRVSWAALVRPIPFPPPPTATEKLTAEIAELEAKLAAIPEEKKICCNAAWMKPYWRLIHVKKLLEIVRHEGL